MFTIRVYGLLIHKGNVLVSDELIKGQRITKFPGGGLEFGEGLKDCLIREIQEEMGLDALDLDHFYTTDFFQQSAFHSRHEGISVYTRSPLLHRVIRRSSRRWEGAAFRRVGPLVAVEKWSQSVSRRR